MEDASDFEFLSILGTRRNWKSECAICLTDTIMGTTCECGHTEIAVLRPCGHALCARPCFEQFVGKSLNCKLGAETFTDGEKVFTLDNSLNVDTKLALTCPLCRVVSTSTFRAENVRIPGSDRWPEIRDLINKMTKRIVNKIRMEYARWLVGPEEPEEASTSSADATKEKNQMEEHNVNVKRESMEEPREENVNVKSNSHQSNNKRCSIL